MGSGRRGAGRPAPFSRTLAVCKRVLHQPEAHLRRQLCPSHAISCAQAGSLPSEGPTHTLPAGTPHHAAGGSMSTGFADPPCGTPVRRETVSLDSRNCPPNAAKRRRPPTLASVGSRRGRPFGGGGQRDKMEPGRGRTPGGTVGRPGKRGARAALESPGERREAGGGRTKGTWTRAEAGSILPGNGLPAAPPASGRGLSGKVWKVLPWRDSRSRKEHGFP